MARTTEKTDRLGSRERAAAARSAAVGAARGMMGGGTGGSGWGSAAGEKSRSEAQSSYAGAERSVRASRETRGAAQEAARAAAESSGRQSGRSLSGVGKAGESMASREARIAARLRGVPEIVRRGRERADAQHWERVAARRQRNAWSGANAR